MDSTSPMETAPLHCGKCHQGGAIPPGPPAVGETLATLPIGERGVVVALDGDHAVATRLLEMGILPGTVVQVVRKAPLGDPLEIRLRGYSLSLRRTEAATVRIRPGAIRPVEREVARVQLPRPGEPADERGTEGPPLVLMAGNPNAGKTTLFNGLTGARLQVGNYPGVTVDLTSAELGLPDGETAEVVDLPGTYSMSARSPEEQIAVDAILGRRGRLPDAVVVVLDASILERSLYLAHQVIETGVPVVLALNMMDEAGDAGVRVDTALLTELLGAEVVPTIGSRGEGLEELREAIGRASRRRPATEYAVLGLSEEACRDLSEVERQLDQWMPGEDPVRRRAGAYWAVLSVGGDELEDVPDQVRQTIRGIRARAEGTGRCLAREVAAARYRNIEQVLEQTVESPPELRRVWTERLDAVLTHRWLGLAVFALVMGALFESLFTWSTPLVELVETWIGWTQGLVTGVLPEGPVRDLLVDGIIAGVGNVLVFVPQIALLFLFLGFLEDSGYLARVAFVIDRLMGGVGLHGKAFVPMLSGFACAVPAVMATRTIESRKDRLLTMLCVPLMSCSARLPVYVLVSAVIFPEEMKLFGFVTVGALVLFVMYALSMVAALTAAAVIRRTVLRAPRPTMVLELPPYRMPILSNLLRNTWERLRSFLVDAGTIILAMTVVIWALLSYPRDAAALQAFQAREATVQASTMSAAARQEALDRARSELGRQQLEHSVAGRLGRVLEPVIRPLGFDWRIGIGIIGAFAAREVFVSTMGTVFGIQDADEENPSLRRSIQNATWPDGSKLFTPLSGVSLMVFFVLACQCMSTVAVVRRESGSWGWATFLVVYMTVLAYLGSLTVYQVGSMMGWGTG